MIALVNYVHSPARQPLGQVRGVIGEVHTPTPTPRLHAAPLRAPVKCLSHVVVISPGACASALSSFLLTHSAPLYLLLSSYISDVSTFSSLTHIPPSCSMFSLSRALPPPYRLSTASFAHVVVHGQYIKGRGAFGDWYAWHTADGHLACFVCRACVCGRICLHLHFQRLLQLTSDS
eukprot:4144605-Pleurochrysis_carterae.AAC.3